MGDLSSAPNLGRALIAELAGVGVTDLVQLEQLGSVETARRLARHGVSVCANKLYALEGAVRGIRWHTIPAQERSELWRRFQDAVPPAAGSL